MRFVIRWTGGGPAQGGYFHRTTSIGPEFTSKLSEAHVFANIEEALQASGGHHGFTMAEVQPLDELAYQTVCELAEAVATFRTMRQQYLGVLGLLGECSVHMRESDEVEELRSLIAEALDDAVVIAPTLRYRRVLNRFIIETVETPAEKKPS